MAAAGVGVSVASNLFPSKVCALVRARQSGDLKSAEKSHRELLPLFKDLFIEPNPIPVKTALGWRGAMSSEVRLPLAEDERSERGPLAQNTRRIRNRLEDFSICANRGYLLISVLRGQNANQHTLRDSRRITQFSYPKLSEKFSLPFRR